MLKFTTAYKQDGTLRKIPGSDRFVVQEPFVWEIDYELKNKGKIVVPAGFGTNFGSIPAFPLSCVPSSLLPSTYRMFFTIISIHNEV